MYPTQFTLLLSSSCLMLDPGLCVFSIRYYLRIIFKCVNLESSSCKFIKYPHSIYILQSFINRKKASRAFNTSKMRSKKSLLNRNLDKNVNVPKYMAWITSSVCNFLLCKCEDFFSPLTYYLFLRCVSTLENTSFFSCSMCIDYQSNQCTAQCP